MLLAHTTAPYHGSGCHRSFLKTMAKFSRDRTPSSSHTLVSWFHDFRMLDDKFILRHSSLDAYLFLRYLRMIVLISVVGCCLTWPILFPINATAGGDASQLDKISFSNINNPKKLYAHAIVAWAFLGMICPHILNSGSTNQPRVYHTFDNA